jgi:glycerol uptake facilitator-like aquaporin
MGSLIHEKGWLVFIEFGAFPGVGVVPYIVAQLLGSVLGVVVARAVWVRLWQSRR